MSFYTLHNFKKNFITYSWAAVYVGRQLNLLLLQSIETYATEYLQEYPLCTDINITELAYGTKDYETDLILAKALKSINYIQIDKDGPVWNFEKRKWRYCILKTMVDSIQDVDLVARELELLYGDFDYPDDMSEFIYYYPESSVKNFQSLFFRK